MRDDWYTFSLIYLIYECLDKEFGISYRTQTYASFKFDIADIYALMKY